MQTATNKYTGLSLSLRGSLLWKTLEDSVKNEPTLLPFKKRTKTGLVINAPVKYAAKFCIMYISTFAVNSWFELVFFYDYYCKYQL